MLFLGGAVFAWRHLPPDVELVRPALLALLGGVLVPATLLLNAGRFTVSARILGREVRLLTALRVSIVASAANLLPLPGAALVRVEGLKRLGEGYGGAIRANAVLAATGIGLTAGGAGVLQLAAGQALLGGVLAVAGFTGLVAAAWLCLWIGGARPGLVAPILGVELGVVALMTLRLWVALLALGIELDVGQALVLALAPIMASAVGILPDGIGLREAVAAGLASFVALPPAVGYLATALDRLVAMAVLVPIALVLAPGVAREAGR